MNITPEYIKGLYAKHGYTPGHTWATHAHVTKREKCACPAAMLCIDKIGLDEWGRKNQFTVMQPHSVAAVVLGVSGDFTLGIAIGFDSKRENTHGEGDWYAGFTLGHETAQLLDCVPV